MQIHKNKNLSFEDIHDNILKGIEKLRSCSNKEELSKQLIDACEDLKTRTTKDYKSKSENAKKIVFHKKLRDSDNQLKQHKIQRQLLKKQLENIGKKKFKLRQPIEDALKNNFEEIKNVYNLRSIEMKKSIDSVFDIKYEKNDEEIYNLDLEKERRLAIAIGLLRKIENVRKDLTIKKVNWRLLPSGDWSLDAITTHYKQLQNENPTKNIDLKRLSIIKKLNPVQCYIGIDEFYGYIVFLFDGKKYHVMENPIVGNAIYLITGDWEEMSKLSKTELLKIHSTKVKRIIHKGDWVSKLKKSL